MCGLGWGGREPWWERCEEQRAPFGDAELWGHVSPSALASLPGHRAFPQGEGSGEDTEHHPPAGPEAHTPWLWLTWLHSPVTQRANARMKLTPPSRDQTAPRHPSAPGVAPREPPKRSLYHGVPAQRTISTPPLSNEGLGNATRGPLSATNIHSRAASRDPIEPTVTYRPSGRREEGRLALGDGAFLHAARLGSWEPAWMPRLPG